MSVRLKLIVAYDGGPFSGWQSQPGRNGIQDHIEQAFERIGGAKVRIHGAGRTDAGVHALAQCAHIDLATAKLTPARWITALNAVLPPAIRVMRCRKVSPDFHARFSAKGKIYRYRIHRAAVLPPSEYGRAWHISAPLNLERMKSAASLFAGRQDFSNFAAKRGKGDEETTRTLFSVRVVRSGPNINLEFDGDGFLYKMVRLIAGTLVQCGLEKISLKEISERLSARDIDRSRVVAPACGLFLVRVRY